MQQVSHKHIVLLYGVCVHHQESKCILEAVWLCNKVLIPVPKVFDSFLFVCTIRYHGGGVCPARSTGCVYEETTDSTQHIVEVPGGLAVGISPQLLGKRGEQKTQSMKTCF